MQATRPGSGGPLEEERFGRLSAEGWSGKEGGREEGVGESCVLTCRDVNLLLSRLTGMLIFSL